MPPKIKLRHSQARMLKDGPAKKTVSAAYVLVLVLALAAAAGACWFFREDLVEFWQPKLQDLADQPAKIQAAQAALQADARATRAPEAPSGAEPEAPADAGAASAPAVVAWEVDFTEPPAGTPSAGAAPAPKAAPAAGTPAAPAPDPEAAKTRAAYKKACELFNSALAAYQEVLRNPTLSAKRDEAERDAQTAVRVFTALRGKLPETVPLEKHLADAESLLRDTRALHRNLTIDAPAAASGPLSTRTAAATRTAGATRTAEATRTAGATRTVGATRTAPTTQTAKPTAVRAPDYNK